MTVKLASGAVCRIAQNLILNALKYTESGGVLVSCAEEASGEARRWALCVKDTGVGLDRVSLTPLAQAINEATQEAHTIAREAAAGETPEPAAASTLASESDHSRRSGEGIGLSIVKRLCELLDASIELETQRGRGTTFRITFPSQYATSAGLPPGASRDSTAAMTPSQ